MVEVRPIAYVQVRDERELLAEYAAECSISALGPPNPQWETYSQLERAGKLQAFAAFVDGRIVGFAGVLVAVIPHYGVKAATVESLFVGKAYRSSGAGTRLMRVVEDYSASSGCRAILYSVPAQGQLETLLDGRCARTNAIFCKPLGKRCAGLGADLCNTAMAGDG